MHVRRRIHACHLLEDLFVIPLHYEIKTLVP
jgi:hypothetical protein